MKGSGLLFGRRAISDTVCCMIIIRYETLWRDWVVSISFLASELNHVEFELHDDLLLSEISITYANQSVLGLVAVLVCVCDNSGESTGKLLECRNSCIV
jgi:hypothetical protein